MKLTIPYFTSLANQLSRNAFRTKTVPYQALRASSNNWSDQCAVHKTERKLSVVSSNDLYRKPLCRSFSTAQSLQADAEMVDVTFITSDGTKLKTKGKIGDNLLDVVVNNSVDLDGFGACEGTLACSTCHLVFKREDFDKIKDKITDEELDMLDLAYGLCDTSRLGCQVTLTKELAGVEVEVPAGVNDARS